MPLRPPCPSVRDRMRGLSLVEIMVSLALGLVLVGGVLSMFVASRETFRHHESLARLQESGRFALELMAREIREAGMTPCGSPITANLLVSPAAATAWWADTASGFLRGGDGSGQGVQATGTSAADHVQGTDSLLVLRTSNDENAWSTLEEHAPAGHSLTLRTAGLLRARDIALLCDDRSSALWQVDTVSANAITLTYAHSPLNCATALGSVDTGCQSPVDKTFTTGARVVAWDPGLWYVGHTGSGQRSLYRAQAIQPAANASSQDLVTRGVEVLPGVHDLQVEYLTRDRNNGGALHSAWRTATDLAGRWADPAFEVAAVRLTLTLRGEAAAGAPPQRTMRAVVALRSREP